MLPPTNATLRDCKQFADAIQKAGGSVPEPLANILTNNDLIAGQAMPSDPARDVVAAAVDGSLTIFRINALINEAALAQMRATYAGDFKRRIEPMMVKAFHQALDDGAADQVLDSLRPSFDKAAEQIENARSLINPESSAEHLIESGTAELTAAWQGLNAHLAVIASIAAIAAQFGCRIARFPLITEYANADGFRLDDRAIVATNGASLEVDSALFKTPDQGHRTSPWFRLPLKLHSVASMRARYRAWCASQWESAHSGPRQQWIDTAGRLREFDKPVNPYLDPEPAT